MAWHQGVMCPTCSWPEAATSSSLALTVKFPGNQQRAIALKTTPLLFHTVFTGVGERHCICEKQLYKAIWGSRGSSAKCDKRPQVM